MYNILAHKQLSSYHASWGMRRVYNVNRWDRHCDHPRTAPPAPPPQSATQRRAGKSRGHGVRYRYHSPTIKFRHINPSLNDEHFTTVIVHQQLSS